jgi:hypothetical protein
MAVEAELDGRSRYYSQQFQKAANIVVNRTVVRALDTFSSKISYQLQNIEFQFTNWEGSNIDSLYKQYTLLEADVSLLQHEVYDL